MPLLNRLLQVSALVISLQISLSGSSPLRPTQTATKTVKHLWSPRAQNFFPLITQAASWPSNHFPKSPPGNQNDQPTLYKLPVVSEVFKDMVLNGKLSDLSPNLSPSPSPDRVPTPPPSPSRELLLAPPSITTNIPTSTGGVNPTGPLQVVGPGIVVVPTLPPSVLPQSSSTSDSANSETHLNPVSARKLVIIGSVLGAIVVSTLLSYILLNHWGLSFCRKKKAGRQSWVPFRIAPDEEKGSKDKGKEKDLPVPPWSLFTSSLSSNDSTVVPRTPEAKTAPHVESRVIDISPDFPRSKFSVSSSDYPCSSSSSNPSFVSAPSTVTRDPTAPAPLMSPSEFFCLPSTTDLQSLRHSRIRSEPVFGHILPTPSQSLATLKSVAHRRSKSVSGLVYIVPPTVCEYPDKKDSGSEWTGSPSSITGNYLNTS